MDQDWVIADNDAARDDAHVTIITKLTDGTNLAVLSTHGIDALIINAVGDTVAEGNNIYVKVRTVQNTKEALKVQEKQKGTPGTNSC